MFEGNAATTAVSTASAQWFANAASIGSKLSTSPILHNVWASRMIFTLHTLAVPLAFWFRPLCVFVALVWLVYRASQVLNKPLNDLSSLLGFDIPSAPFIDLANVKADGAVIHWTLLEKPKQKSTLKYEIHLNGTVIDAISIHESAVTITGLQPASFHVVRVALVNNNEFSSKSAAVRFRTKPAASEDFFIPGAEGHETDSDGTHEPMPRARPFRALNDITPASPTSTPMAREGSAGLIPRRSNARRLSPTALGLEDKHDPQLDESEPLEGAETIQQLTEKLDALRRDTEEAERQAKEEEEDELRQKEELTKERDELKAEALEREKASRNLKREVNTLERQNTAAQNERAKQERLLQQKTQERQKLKQDMVRWEREVAEMRADVERITRAKATYFEQMAQDKEILRARQAEEATKMHSVDDEVKERTAELKKFERAMKNSSPNGSEQELTLVQQYQNDADEERNWQMRRHALQQQYQMAYSKVESAKRFHAEQMRYLESLRAERRRQDEVGPYSSQTLAQERLPRRGDSQRSKNTHSRHSVSDSPRLGAFPVNHSPFASHIAPVPPGFSTPSFLNIQNGMTIPGPTEEVIMSEEDKEKLTGGAPMSPGAGAELIPADLFLDGDSKPPVHVQPLPGLGSLPGFAGPPPHPSMQDYPAAGPASPGSVSSRSPSIFVSPQASQHNLQLGSPEHGLIDPDRRSIRSTRSNRAASGGTSSRFTGMFGIKGRTKTMSEEGPPLGKASSMPRQDQGIPGLDAASRKRNSSMSGAGPTDGSLDGSSETPTAPSKRTFALFSKEKGGGWPSSFTPFGRRPPSPRPGSTHSIELPRPSMDSSRWGVDNWPPSDSASGARGSPLAFGPGWTAPSQQPRLYGSRHPSRRPSVQYAASGPPEDILEDDDSDVLDPDQTPHLAPIGTKPHPGSKKADSSAKLNPNAKDFKSFFSSMKFGKDKGKDGGESSDKTDGGVLLPSTSASNVPPSAGTEPEESPPNSRKSRDTRSVATAETTESSLLESGRNSAELVRTPSYSNSDAPAPSPSLAGSSKETFMQKITRKSSSSKFSLPTFKREKSRLDAGTPYTSNTSAPVPAEEEEHEEELSASVSSLKEREPRESKEGNRSSRSWSSVLKIGKKKGVETASLSGTSLADGDEDGDEEEE